MKPLPRNRDRGAPTAENRFAMLPLYLYKGKSIETALQWRMLCDNDSSARLGNP